MDQVVGSATARSLTAPTLEQMRRSTFYFFPDVALVHLLALLCGGEAEASTVQTATTLSVVVTAVGPCPGGNSLSTGAIVGIAVGATVAGVLLILLVAFMVKRSTQNRTKKLNQRIHNETLDL